MDRSIGVLYVPLLYDCKGLVMKNPYLTNSLSARMRRRRFDLLLPMIEKICKSKGRCSVLDLGGTEYYWNLMSIPERRLNLHVLLCNVGDPTDSRSNSSLFTHLTGDVTTPDAYGGEFDIIHSNSVIEHVGPWNKMRAMAGHVVASGKPYFVQTPNVWFPLEPHFRTVGFQWLPPGTRAAMLLRRKRGFRSANTFDEAMESVESVNLLDRRQLSELFPDAVIRSELFGPFVKSLIAIRS